MGDVEKYDVEKTQAFIRAKYLVSKANDVLGVAGLPMSAMIVSYVPHQDFSPGSAAATKKKPPEGQAGRNVS